MKRNIAYLKISVFSSMLILNSCSSTGGGELNTKCLQKVKDLHRVNSNREAVETARRCNGTTYNEALVYMIQQNQGYWLSDKEIAKVQAMNNPSLQSKLDFQYQNRARSSAMLKRNQALHANYLKSDAYQKQKNHNYQQAQKRNNNNSYTNSSQNYSYGPSNFGKETQEITDRYNKAVKSAADKESSRLHKQQYGY